VAEAGAEEESRIFGESLPSGLRVLVEDRAEDAPAAAPGDAT
jgi:hypothetical protein